MDTPSFLESRGNSASDAQTENQTIAAPGKFLERMSMTFVFGKFGGPDSEEEHGCIARREVVEWQVAALNQEARNGS